MPLAGEAEVERPPDEPLTLEEVRRRVAEVDPLLVAAAAEVDRSLIRWSLSLTPLERLCACTRATRALARARRVAPPGS